VSSVLLALLVGCGGGGSPAADGGADVDAGADQTTCVARSGDRLRLRLIEGGGQRVVEGVHDRDLETDCALEQLGASTRCLPTQTARGTIFFSDDACTQRILLPDAPLGDAPPKFHRVNVARADGCGADAELSPITGALPFNGTETIFSGGPAACTAVTAAAATYHTLGAPAGEDAFVAAELVDLGTGGPIIQRVFDAADGSRLCQGALHDTEREIDCTLTVAEDGAVRCLPAASPPTTVFAEATCTTSTEIVVHDASCGRVTPSFTSRVDGNFCFPRTRLRTTGELLGQKVYQGDPATCTERTFGAQQSALAIGPGVAPFGFPAVSVDNVPGGDRLQRSDAVVEGGPRLGSTSFFDPELGAPCSFRVMNDESLRCAPTSSVDAPLATATALFGDALCAAATVEVGIMVARCLAYTPSHATRSEGPGLRVFPVIEPYSGPLFTADGACTPIDTSGGGYYALGAELVGDALVEGVRRVE
jgi:hypothetical protein